MNDSEIAPLLQSVRRARALSGWLARATGLLGLAGTAWVIVDPVAAGEFLMPRRLVDVPGIAPWQGVGLMAVAIAQIAVWAAALQAFRTLFTGMLDAPPFPPTAAAAARRAWRRILAALLLSIVAKPVTSVLSTWHYPVGDRVLAIEFTTQHLVTLVALVLTAIMARALSLAAALWRDAQEIV